MPKVTINGKEIDIEQELTVIQVCDLIGVQIPRFCYHDKLPAVGSCRMCLVELKGSKKLIPSCSTAVFDGMEVVTESENIDNARKSVLGMLLVNHPLDCPICDKGGECDLQDQTYRYGLDRSQVMLEKRAVAKKDFGPLIDPYMTRCIHCTRCIRFATEIAGVDDLGGIGRGDHTEIDLYVGKTLTSELSGNLADVCPVGALTNSDYAYKARSWELISTESIDVMDAVGSNIKVDCSEVAVLRIMPKPNDEINEDWLADKSRYIVDALRVQRLDMPMIRINGKLRKSTWDEAFLLIAKKIQQLKSTEIAAVAGDFVNVETLYAMKDLMHKLGSNQTVYSSDQVLDTTDRASYLFNTTIAGIEESDACLIIGSNPKVEAPIVNARIRKRYLRGDFHIALIGEKCDLNYKYDHIGDNISSLEDILEGRGDFVAKLNTAKKPMLILGLGAFSANNAQEIISLCKQIALKYNMVQSNWNGYNFLSTSTSMINALEVGFSNNNFTKAKLLAKLVANDIKLLWLMNADNLEFEDLSEDTFVVYQGHHGDSGAASADVILPAALWLEQDGMYVNIEGRVQKAYKAIPSVGEAKDSWKIIRKFAEYLDVSLSYDTIEDIRKVIALYNPIFKSTQLVKAIFREDNIKYAKNINSKIKSLIADYYITDIISRNSIKMTECSRLFNDKNIQHNSK